MDTYARVAGGVVAELIRLPPGGPPPAALFHPDIAGTLHPVPAAEAAQVAEGWHHGPQGFAPPPPPAPPLPGPALRTLSPFAFRRRLPPEVRQAVTLAASRALEAGDAALQTWLDDLSAAQVVELDHPEVVAGADALLAAGLITPAQRAALLADAEEPA